MNATRETCRTTARTTRRLLRCLFAAFALLLVVSAEVLGQEKPAGGDAAVIEALLKRVGELEQRIQQLERQASLSMPVSNSGASRPISPSENGKSADAAPSAAKTQAARVNAGERGFSISSTDTNFVLQLKGIVQADTRTFFEDAGQAGNDAFLLRRARPILQGTVYRQFDFLLVPEFGGTGSPQIYDAFVNFRAHPWLQLQAGKFKVPVGLEHLQADKDTFFNERAFPTSLTPNRDVGFQVHGNVRGGLLSYAAGVFNGVGDARQTSNTDFDDSRAFAGRVFIQPFHNAGVKSLDTIGIGVGGSWEEQQQPNTAGLPSATGGNLPGYFTAGQQQFFAYNPSGGAVTARGEHLRVAPQASYRLGPFSMLGEYTLSQQEVQTTGPIRDSERLGHTAWQVAAGWVFTGEEASFAGIVPRRPFNPLEGRWGALQMVARFSELSIDTDAFPTYSNPDTSARAAHEWAVGLNWYMNRNLRVNMSFSQTRFDGGGGDGNTAPSTTTRGMENVLFTRVQLAF